MRRAPTTLIGVWPAASCRHWPRAACSLGSSAAPRAPVGLRLACVTEARPGHIPGSVNRPYTADVERAADGLWFRPRARLEADYAAAGVSGDEPVVVSCRTGHQASQSFFVLRWLLGRKNVRWYNGSWTEWAARSDLPAQTGDDRRSER